VHLLKNKAVGPSSPAAKTTCRPSRGSCSASSPSLAVQFPQFPYIAHSRGWSAEDMERNVEIVRSSEALKSASHELVDRCVDLAERLLATTPPPVPRSGRKGRALPLLSEK
jgi:hypothetical protein